MTQALYHGGAPEIWRGKTILPDQATRRYHAGCKICEAQRNGRSSLDPATPHGFVYAIADIPYARYYASRFGSGWLYEVTLSEDAEPSTEDMFPTWRASSAKVARVIEKRITLTMDERQALFIRWGGTEAEFNAMVASTMGTMNLPWVANANAAAARRF